MWGPLCGQDIDNCDLEKSWQFTEGKGMVSLASEQYSLSYTGYTV